MNPKDKDFKKLQSLWYKKLKAKGFEDAEQRDGNLKEWHSFHFVKPSHGAASDSRHSAYNTETSEYYRRAEHFLHANTFKNISEKQIWELHSEGKSVKHFRSRSVRSQWKVYHILKKLIAEMKETWNQD